MMNFDADLDIMFDPSVFGDYVQLPDGRQVTGIFEQNPVVLDEGGTSVSTNTQLVTLKESDTPYLGQGDQIVIRNCVYAVSDIRPDGTGVVELTIHKV